MKNKTWFANYDKWEKDCLQELKDEYGMTDVSHVDICENGSVYFGNCSLTEPGYVTPWKDSKWFAD